MTDPDLRFTTRDGRRLAYRFRPAHPMPRTAPTMVFLPGYMSDMTGGKATALDTWAAATGHAMLRFDYGGCGESDGEFAEQTLEDWRDDVLYLMRMILEGPVILVGSSMGGWLMLLIALARPERVKGIIGIAAAPDFTGWGFSDAERRTLATGGMLSEPGFDPDQPYITTAKFWRSGEANRLLGGAIDIDCPVRLLHGQADTDVPFDISLQIADQVTTKDVVVTLVKDGDHRLSRDEDIERLIETVAALVVSASED
ncbi:MAG: alpha/beta hydrolase [Pacificimonas sp.]